MILNNLGGIPGLERYEQALAYYEQRPLLHDVGRRAEEGTVLTNLGEVASALSHMAGDCLPEQALAIAREVQNRAGEAITLNNLGRALCFESIRAGHHLL